MLWLGFLDPGVQLATSPQAAHCLRSLVPLRRGRRAEAPVPLLYMRDLEQRGHAPATISRQLSTVAGLFRYAVLDELVAPIPTLAVTRPHMR